MTYPIFPTPTPIPAPSSAPVPAPAPLPVPSPSHAPSFVPVSQASTHLPQVQDPRTELCRRVGGRGGSGRDGGRDIGTRMDVRERGSHGGERGGCMVVESGLGRGVGANGVEGGLVGKMLRRMWMGSRGSESEMLWRG